MNFYVCTLFPEWIRQAAATSILGRASAKGYIQVNTLNIRDYSTNKHNRVDDYPYGGGAGMVMEAEPVYQAVQEARRRGAGNARVVYLTPQGHTLDQILVEELALEENLILLCGHYEGIDERVLEETVTDYVSIGDYVLTGGELGAMVLIDAVSRFVPGVLGNEDSAQYESMQDHLLEHPQYTRPEVWRGKTVPSVLLSGAHTPIVQWQKEQALQRTAERRPDLLRRRRKLTAVYCGLQAEEQALALAAHLTRYEETLNLGRKKLRKKHYVFSEEDLLLLYISADWEEELGSILLTESQTCLPQEERSDLSAAAICWHHLLRQVRGKNTAVILLQQEACLDPEETEGLRRQLEKAGCHVLLQEVLPAVRTEKEEKRLGLRMRRSLE